MAKDYLYTNGVIASREKTFLNDRILRLAELPAAEAFRALTESGFGAGAEVYGAHDCEKLIAAEEAALDEFIREYAPSDTELKYFLAPRDFHNAKAALKAYAYNLDGEKMFAPEGLIPLKTIQSSICGGQFAELGKILGGAAEQAAALIFDEEGKKRDVSGADVGAVFEKAEYEYLIKSCGRNSTLKKLIAEKADMNNILTALRSPDAEYAQKMYVSGGKVKVEKLDGVFNGDADKAAHALDGTAYEEFYKSCLAAVKSGRPFTDAEKLLSTAEARFFAERKYELERKEPFLYYVLRKRIEIENVRILFVCLNAGLKEQEIKRRLRLV